MKNVLRSGLPALVAALLAAGTAGAGERGPWMAAPYLSSNPKLGTALGATGGILYYFDERSRASLFGVNALYTSTDSAKASLTARTSFGADRHRVKASLSAGRINNEYEDYLGTGIALNNVETAFGAGASYLYRVKGDWFAGAQGVIKNYQVVGQSPSDDEVLAALGVAGMQSGGIGAVVQNDTRDSDNRPTRGRFLSLDNFAFRTWLGSDFDYDLYRLDLRGYWGHGGGHVFAVRQNNQWTVDAPLEAQSSIALRGYKSGQYLAEHVSTIEAEERFRLAKR